MTRLANACFIALCAVLLGMAARYYLAQSPRPPDDPVLDVAARPLAPVGAAEQAVVTAGVWNVVVFLSGAECPPCVDFVAAALDLTAQRPASVKTVFVNASREEALQAVGWLQWRETALWDEHGRLSLAFQGKRHLPYLTVWSPQRKLVYQKGPVFTDTEKASELRAILALLPQRR